MSKKDKSGFTKKQLHKDNRGSTLVVVIVSMLLLCVLASVILFSTHVNYTIKTTELRSTDNFYTAESIMEEIKAGLAVEVSNAYTNAYLYVMQNYSSGDDEGAVLRATSFQTRYINYLRNELSMNPSDPIQLEQIDADKLLRYVSGTVSASDGEVEFADGSSAKLEFAPADGKSLVAYTDGVWIKGLRLTYTNSEGYVAVITTDIALKIPNLTFGEQNILPGVLSYSLIADDKLYVGVTETAVPGQYAPVGGNYTIRGSVYGGRNGISVWNSQAAFEASEAGGSYFVVTGGDIDVQGLSGDNAGFVTNGNASLWADGIVLNSSTLNLSGESYIQDDLTVNGRNSSLMLAGHYYGYGYQSVSTSSRGPKDSSSILINGMGVKLNFSALTELDLAGQAYIGTTDSDDDGIKDDPRDIFTEDGSSYNTSANEEVRMGESLSVKTNQLAYLVPPECIGYINGECVLGANPVSLSQYQEFMRQATEAGVNYQEVDLTKAVLNAGLSMTLRDYGADSQRVFYQAPGEGNNAWVYYYLKFDSAAQANAFFADYYDQNKNWINSYLRNYLAEYHVPAAMGKLNLAGNAVYYDAGTDEFILQPASALDTAEDALALLSEYERYSNINKALNINLTTNYAALTQDQIDRASVFQNIVDVTKLREYMGGAVVKEVVASGGQRVLLIDNAGGATYTIDDSAIKAVVATGDVKVTVNFKGMLLSGGRVFVTSAARIEPDPDEVSLALQADNGQLLACFWDGRSFAQATDESGSSGTNGVVTTDELVVYRNWKKE